MKKRNGSDDARGHFTIEYVWRAWAMPYMARLAIRYAQARNPGVGGETETSSLLDSAEHYLHAKPDSRMKMYAELANMGMIGTRTIVSIEPSHESSSDLASGKEPKEGQSLSIYSGTLTQVSRPEDHDFWLDGALYQDLDTRNLRICSTPLGYWLRNCWLHGARRSSSDLLEVPPSASHDEELLSAIKHDRYPDSVDIEKLLFKLGIVMEQVCLHLQPKVKKASQNKLTLRKAYLRQCLSTPSVVIKEVIATSPHPGPKRHADADHIDMLSMILQEDAYLGSVVNELSKLIEEGAEVDLARSLRHMRKRCGQDLRLTVKDDARGGCVISVTDVARRSSLAEASERAHEVDAPRVLGIELSPGRLSMQVAWQPATHTDSYPLAQDSEPMTECERAELASKEAIEDAKRSLGELDPDLIDGVVDALVKTTGGGLYPLAEASAQIPVNTLAAAADEPYIVACVAEELRRGVRGISASDALRFVVTGELPDALDHLAPGKWPPLSKTNAVPRWFIELAMDFSLWLWAEFLHDLADDGAQANPLWKQAFAEALSNLLVKAVFGASLEGGVVTTLKERARKKKARPAGARAAGGMDSSLTTTLKRIRDGEYVEIAADEPLHGRHSEGSV